MGINWDILLHELETGKCVLCVGPDVFSAADNERMERALADTLRARSHELGIRVYDDGWFHYLPQRDEVATWFQIKRFYDTQLPPAPEAVFSAIAQLPFHLVLNFSPDYRLREAFRREGRAFEFDCFYKTPELNHQRLPERYVPDKDKPLIFNMLGEIDDKDSLVMTYDDLFGFMEAFFEKKRLPAAVKLKIQQATHFIFLGMPLDKWYFHLFMRMLNMHRDTVRTKRFAATFAVNGENATFCEEQYSLTFVQENIPQFTTLFSEKWQAAQQAKTGVAEKSRYERWRDLAAAGEDVPIRKLLVEIKDALREMAAEDLTTTQLLLEMQWNGFASAVFETVMQRNAMKTQIVNGLLYLVGEIEKRNPNARP